MMDGRKFHLLYQSHDGDDVKMTNENEIETGSDMAMIVAAAAAAAVCCTYRLYNKTSAYHSQMDVLD